MGDNVAVKYFEAYMRYLDVCSNAAGSGFVDSVGVRTLAEWAGGLLEGCVDDNTIRVCAGSVGWTGLQVKNETERFGGRRGAVGDGRSGALGVHNDRVGGVCDPDELDNVKPRSEDVPVDGSSGLKPGRWAKSNRRKKEVRRAKRNGMGFCETVVSQASVDQSSCPSYGQAVSDAEREAKESLAKRRAAENALQEKLAKMKLADLEDEQKCQEYAQLKRQRVIQWTNEATAKSQQSLDKCKSIDPGSSSSQFEIRKQAKEFADLKMQHAHLIKVFHDAVPDAAKIIAMTKLPGTESMERYQFEGEFIGGWGDDHSISS